MNNSQFEVEIEELKKTLKDGLLSTIIFDKDSEEIIMEYNYTPNSTKAYNSIIKHTLNIFREYKLDNIDKYMLFHLENNKILVILSIYNYRWTLLVNNNQVKLGVLLNIVIPNMRNKFQDIIKVA